MHALVGDMPYDKVPRHVLKELSGCERAGLEAYSIQASAKTRAERLPSKQNKPFRHIRRQQEG
jgi:hypothetical protein